LGKDVKKNTLQSIPSGWERLHSSKGPLWGINTDFAAREGFFQSFVILLLTNVNEQPGTVVCLSELGVFSVSSVVSYYGDKAAVKVLKSDGNTGKKNWP
jgi:hypothetical protein